MLRKPRVRRAIYSLLIVVAGLATFYFVTAILPNPGRWMYSATANGALLFITTIAFVVFGAPAWGITYILLGLLGIPRTPHPGKVVEVPPAE